MIFATLFYFLVTLSITTVVKREKIILKIELYLQSIS